MSDRNHPFEAFTYTHRVDSEVAPSKANKNSFHEERSMIEVKTNNDDTRKLKTMKVQDHGFSDEF